MMVPLISVKQLFFIKILFCKALTTHRQYQTQGFRFITSAIRTRNHLEHVPSIRLTCRYIGRNREGLGKPKGYLDPRSRYVLEYQTLSGLPSKDNFIVLGIETSCDDTGVAVVSSNGTILSNVVCSQYAIHERFGGVVPGLAMEAHKSNLDGAVARALSQAGLESVRDVDAVCVTKGPGLEICLRVGLRKAQALAQEFGKPFVTVHHLEAHCMVARLAGLELGPDQHSPAAPMQPLSFPFLSLLVSGGHTSLLICRDLGEYSVIGGTLDDSLGEAFDKAARLLGLRTGTRGREGVHGGDAWVAGSLE